MQVRFYTKPTATKKDCLIFARINYGYKAASTKYLSVKHYLDFRIVKDCWDVKNQCARKSMIGRAEFDLRITNAKERIQKCFNGYVNQQGKEPDVQELKKLLAKEFTGKEVTTLQDKLNTFKGYFQDFIDQSVNGVRKTVGGNNLSPSTIKNYQTMFNHLTAFEVKRKRSIDFDNIDFEFYTDLVNYFELDLLMAKNSIAKHIRTLKTVMRESLENGVHSNNKFTSKKFAAPTEDTDSIYLNTEELAQMTRLDLSHILRLDRVRDLFIIACHTGLRYSDLDQIQPNNIHPDPKNPTDEYLHVLTKKTKTPVMIPVPPVLTQMLKKYNNVLPSPLKNQKVNASLKEICKMVPEFTASVDKTITKGGVRVTYQKAKYDMVSCHTSRRSFASNAYLSGQEPINIMAITGHRSETAFYKYIKITPLEKARLYKQHDDKQQGKLVAI